MPRENMGEYSSFYTPNRKLAYDNEFRESLREHPEIIKTVKKLFQQASENYDPEPIESGNLKFVWNKETSQWNIQNELTKEQREVLQGTLGRNAFLKPGTPVEDPETGLKVTALGKINRLLKYTSGGERLDVGDYHKLEIGDKAYFVKRNEVTLNPGYAEFESNKTAEVALEDLDFVTVIPARFGYHDEKQSWYVSDWQDLESAGYNSMLSLQTAGLNDYGNKVGWLMSNFGSKEEQMSFTNKHRQINERLMLSGFKDVQSNLFYNPRTEKFIYVDATSPHESMMLGNALTSSKEEII